MKIEDILINFEESINFYKNVYILDSLKNVDNDKSFYESPTKKGYSKTLHKKPTMLTQFKVNERKQRSSFNGGKEIISPE